MHIDTIRFPGSVIDRLEELGSFFSRVCNVLGADGLVIDSKGEGMYIGALCAARSV